MIYLDSNVVIRLIEGDDAARLPLEARLASIAGKAHSVVTSKITRLESRSKPIRNGDAITLKEYDKFFSSAEVVMADVGDAVLDKATELRANFNFKGLDAIHLATAILSGATVFLTGDKQLARCTEITVEIL